MSRTLSLPSFSASRTWSSWFQPLALVLSLCCAGQAQAGLFEDDEARRAIIDMRQQRTQDIEAEKGRNDALAAQIELLKRSLLDMNAQIEQLRADLARQQGQSEVLARDLSDTQRRQKDLQSNIDDRVRKLEPQPVTVDGKTFKVDPDEKKAFDEALARMRAADFAGGAASMNALLQRYPSTGYKEAIWYWQGNAYYGLRQYKDAIASFKLLIDASPDHQRAPEALLSIANCFSELKDADTARKTLELVVRQYPQSEAAQAAKDRLATMPAATPAAGASKRKTK